ncbi:response regulator [Actinospongicola halichondriae]|uniref:response regulator n=1 Tax=Actinospongicola halichondriae TaxID=3236844 RepID=UPI003D5CB135
MTTPAPTRPVEVLLVEDNPGDALITEEAFEQAKVAINLIVCEDGPTALAHLESAIGVGGPMLPDLILLDLNLPGMSGLQVLENIRHHDDLLHIPVIVMTSSTAPEDVRAAYRGHANSFISKPVRPQEFLDAVKSLESYWLTVVRLPSDR